MEKKLLSIICFIFFLQSCHPFKQDNEHTVKIKSGDETKEVSGTVFGKEESRFVKVNGIKIDVVPQGYLLVSENNDRPGFIGSMSSILGSNDINIGLMHLGREAIGGRAIVFTNVDATVPQKAIDEISALEDIISVTQVSF